MLRHWKGALVIVAGALCPLLEATAAADSPIIPALLGVNLGSTHITAATINDSGTFPLVLFEASQGYIDFMNNTTNPELSLEHYYDESLNVMSYVLEDVRTRASHTNGEDIRIGAILAPEHFTIEMRRLVFRSWDAPDEGVWIQPVRPVSYSAIAYPEDNCVDRIYDPMPRHWQSDWVLMFHQDFDHLYISLTEVTTYLFDTMSQDVSLPTSADSVANIIAKFLRDADDFEDYPNITSVVLSSHNSNASFEVVHEALDKIDVQLWKRRKISSLELNYIGAVGAACMARQLAIYPIENDGEPLVSIKDLPDYEITMPANCFYTSENKTLDSAHCVPMLGMTGDEWIGKRHLPFMSNGGCQLSSECKMPQFVPSLAVHPDCTCRCDGQMVPLSNDRCKGFQGVLDTRDPV